MTKQIVELDPEVSPVDADEMEIQKQPGGAGTSFRATIGNILAPLKALVDANTAANAGTVLVHSDVSDVGSGAIITGAERSKLAGIESGATADQTDAEIKIAYENNLDTNEFSDAEQAKLAGIETGAQSNTTSNLGAGEGLAQTKAGSNLPFKSLTAGTDIELNATADELEIRFVGAGGAGDVLGPANNTDETVPVWNGADSKTLKDTLISLADLTILTDGSDADALHGHADFAGAGTTGVVPDPGAEGDTFLRDDGTFAAPPTSPVGGVSLSYKFDTNITASNPGAGRLSVNNADQTLATELYASDATALGNDATIVWANVVAGEFVGIWDVNSAKTIYYEVTADAVDNGNWFTLGISNVPGTVGGFTNNEDCEIFFIADPANKIPPNGGAGQVLTKNSSTSYDMSWKTLNVLNLTAAAATAFAVGEIGFIDSNGDVKSSNAGAAVSAEGLLVMATEVIGVAGTGLFVTAGPVSVTGPLTPGAPQWLSLTDKLFTETQPSGSDEYVRKVGYALDATTIMFNPDETVIKLVT
jgi:hypothetical protein